MNQDERAPFVRALQRARVPAYAPGEFVEQESFMRAAEIRALAGQAGIAPGGVCRTCAAELPGPDGSSLRSWVAPIWAWTLAPAPLISHVRAPATFPVASRSHESLHPSRPVRRGAPVRDHARLSRQGDVLEEISRALTTGGRFAFTMEEGLPLTEAERESMPDADTVWLTPLQEMLTCLERVGMRVRWQDDCSRSHRAVADSLINAFAADATDIAGQIGRRALEEGRPPTGSGATCGKDGAARSLSLRRRQRTPRTTVAGVAASRRS